STYFLLARRRLRIRAAGGVTTGRAAGCRSAWAAPFGRAAHLTIRQAHGHPCGDLRGARHHAHPDVAFDTEPAKSDQRPAPPARPERSDGSRTAPRAGE